MANLSEFLPEMMGGGPFTPVHPILRDVKSGKQGHYAKVDWDALAKLMKKGSTSTGSKAIGGVAGQGSLLSALLGGKNLSDEDIALARMATGQAKVSEIKDLFKAKPEVIETYTRLLNDARRKTQKKIEAKPSWFDRVVDVLSRPMYAGVNFVGEALNSKTSKASNPFEAFGKGLWGTEKQTTGKLINELGWKKTDSFLNNWARAATSFAGDVLLDPTTYFFGAGAAKNIGTKAAVKAGQVAKIGHEIEHIGSTLGDTAKIGTRVPGASVAGVRSADESFADFAKRIGDRLKSDKPYLSRREVRQVRDVLGTRLGNAIGSEAENKLVKDIMKTYNITDAKIVEKLGDSSSDLATLLSNPKIAQHYNLDTAFWDNLRAKTFQETEIPWLKKPGKKAFEEKQGLTAARAEERSKNARAAIDEVNPILEKLEALPQMKRYEVSAGVPFTRFRKAWEIPGIERKTGKFVEKMEAVSKGARPATFPTKVVAAAWKQWDDTFSTAMKRDPSLAAARTDFQSKLSHTLESISNDLNNSFKGLNKVDRQAVMNAIKTGTVKNLSHITNHAGESMDKVVGDFFEKQAGFITDTLNVHGGGYAGIGENLTTGVPRKYRINKENWDEFISQNKLHPRKKAMTGDDLAKFYEQQYGILSKGRHGPGLGKDLDPAEALYHLAQGTHGMANRRGFIDALKQFGVNQGFHKYDPVSKKRTGVTNPAGIRQIELSQGKLRKLQEADFGKHELDDPHLKAARNALKDTAFPEELIPDLIKTLKMTNPKNPGAIAEGYVNIMQRWKRLNTIWNVPRYHLRNTYSDLAMNHLNGLAPNSMFRPNSAYGKASKTLYAVAPNRQVREMIGDIYKQFNPGEYPNLYAKQNELRQQLMSGAGITQKQADALMKPLIKKGGEELNALDIYSLYRQHGLESHFMNEDIARANLHRSEKLSLRNPMRKPGEAVFQASAVRENYFRVANFIHSMERGLGKGWDLERAAQQAAEDVRKYNFDYSDVTPRENFISQRVLPFYKWSRKAIPLLGATTFTNPRVMAIWNHFQDAVQTATGIQDVDKNNPLPGFYDRVPSSMIEGGAFPVASRFGDPVMSSGIPNLWRDTLPFLAAPQYKEGGRNEAGHTLDEVMKMIGGMTGPVGQGFGWSGFGGMPGIGASVAETPAGSKGQDWMKFLLQSIGGPANLGRRYLDSRAYNETQKNYPEGMKIDPVLLSYLTGTDTRQLTSPQQMYAMQELIDMLKEAAKSESYKAGRLTGSQRLQQNQSWNKASQSSTMDDIMALFGGGG